jgi:hypothetical protein
MNKKKTYRIRNWKNYNKALVKRGSLTLYFDENAINNWHNRDEPNNKRGRPKEYTDTAITCMLTIRSVFDLPLRATQGLTMSLIELMELTIRAADYTTLCKRQNNLEIGLERYKHGGKIYGVFDATGLKIFGEGEWKVRQHSYSKRRTWRKLHLGINEQTKEIIAAALTTNNVSDGEVLPNLIDQIDESISQVSGDGAYDSFDNHNLLNQRGIKITIPPQKNAKIRQHGNNKVPPLSRDEIIRDIRKLGRAEWKKQSGYHRRSIAETTMFRFKKIFGEKLKSILVDNQAVEAFIKCNILNKMTSLGMPESYVVT